MAGECVLRLRQLPEVPVYEECLTSLPRHGCAPATRLAVPEHFNVMKKANERDDPDLDSNRWQLEPVGPGSLVGRRGHPAFGLYEWSGKG
jgi:hypothetical protein